VSRQDLERELREIAALAPRMDPIQGSSLVHRLGPRKGRTKSRRASGPLAQPSSRSASERPVFS
jgi:hypothetical protein